MDNLYISTMVNGEHYYLRLDGIEIDNWNYIQKLISLFWKHSRRKMRKVSKI